MVGQISTALAAAKLNIADLLNKSRGELAYTLIDIDGSVPRVRARQAAGDRRRARGAGRQRQHEAQSAEETRRLVLQVGHQPDSGSDNKKSG